MTTPRQRYSFAAAALLDDDERVRLLGRKAATLADLRAAGLPIPPGFTLTTDVARGVSARGWAGEVDREILDGLGVLQDVAARRLGDPDAPLLVSVRSGATVSMPGMLETVVNVGMTDEVASGLAVLDHGRFAADTHRRFLRSYALAVRGVDPAFVRRESLRWFGDGDGRHLDGERLAAAVVSFRAALRDAGHEIPADPVVQVTEAVRAVMGSWRSERADAYRRREGIDPDPAVAVTVQAMVFGNRDDRSGTGVVFSRDPVTGAGVPVGDFLVRAQGDDVVGGSHPSRPFAELGSEWPTIAAELRTAVTRLERRWRTVVEVEFTIEHDRLWILQARPARAARSAALRIAVEMADDPDFPLTRAEAVERTRALLPRFVPGPEPSSEEMSDRADDGDEEVLASGVAASPGRVVGVVCTSAATAGDASDAGKDVVLFRPDTAPGDVAAMSRSVAVVTATGGLSSHAAVIARAWGIPTVVGASAITVGPAGIVIDGESFPEGTVVTVDGDRGVVLRGARPLRRPPEVAGRTLAAWRERAPAITATSRPFDDHEAATPGACRRVLAIKGGATGAVVAAALGRGRAEVDALLRTLVDAGEATTRAGGGVLLTALGRARAEEDFAEDVVRIGPELGALVDEFGPVNDRVKRAVSHWQHAGGDRGAAHVATPHDTLVATLRDDVQPAVAAIIARAASLQPAFARYERRLRRALVAIEAGDASMVDDPVRDSYHTVWFELHEELLRRAGRVRG